MSIVQNLKRALGFSETDDEAELQALANADDNLRSSGIVNPFRREAQPRSVETGEPQPELTGGAQIDPFGVTPAGNTDGSSPGPADQSLTEPLFNAVIELINREVPGVFRAGINVEAQRRYIFDSIDSELRARLSASRSSGRWVEERARLLAEIDRLKSGNTTVDKLKSEMEALRLSARRQKSALSDRATDLEMKVEELTRQNEALSAENTRLISDMKKAGVKGGAPSSQPDPQVARLKSQMGRLEKENRQLRADKEALEKDCEVWRSDVEKIKTKSNIGDAMLSDTRSQLAKARKELETLKKGDSHTAELEDTVRSLSRQLADTRQRLADTERSLEEARAAKPQSGKRRRGKKHNKVNAIDENSTDTSWLIAGQPADAASSLPPRDDSDFGYQEPKRKTIPDNDRQMSLF